MDNIFSIYKKLIIKEVIYETGDLSALAKCSVVLFNQTVNITIVISHTDLNRIISKIVAMGYEFKAEKVSALEFDDGTEIMEYRFDNVFGENIVLENFEFRNIVKEIRA